MKRLSQRCGGARRKRATIADERLLDAARAGRARRRARADVLRREERRVDHHRAGDLVTEIARKTHCDPPAK